jgi:hypothetical protein
MIRTILSVAMIGVVLLSGASTRAEQAAEEPTLADCTKAVEEGRSKANQLSPKSLSRYFAERFLQSAETEAGNGEYDECVEYAEKSVDEAENRWRRLAPGETFRVTTSTGYLELRGDDQDDQ